MKDRRRSRRFSTERDSGGSKAALVRWPGACDSSHAGQRREPRAKRLDERGFVGRGVSRGLWKLNIEIDDLFAVVAGFRLEGVNGASNQHASGDQKRERKSYLYRDKDALQTAAANRRSAVSSDGGKRGAGAFECGRQSEQD